MGYELCGAAAVRFLYDSFPSAIVLLDGGIKKSENVADTEKIA